MIKTLSPCSNTAKTAEIMSRYRPIAPKPEVSESSGVECSFMSQKIKQFPCLRNIWPELQARPTRTRKRGRAAFSPTVLKRARTQMHGLPNPTHAISSASHLLAQGFTPAGTPHLSLANLVAVNNNMENQLAGPSDLVTLPLMPCTPSIAAVAQKTVPEHSCMDTGKEQLIDLNKTAEIPEEKDLLQQLKQECPTSIVIAPQPVRPVGSSIFIGCINEDTNLTPPVQVSKKAEEVEEEVESETFPAVISDSNNKVRLVNSAYKEMVGQPECPWLDSMISNDGRLSGACKRICGEVILHLSESRVPISSNGFSCWVRIEWGNEGKKNSTNAFCDVMRLSCKSKDYLFTWRFHTHNREGSQSSTNF
ncbi:hypothetical protein K2173_007885 [Erythroxylum novogranatense]|uniref:DUF7950 domain-containing protein n=1 Tax=Erythroxylum novogranatense TaxID=1862640 RepID=A0AAV8T6N7_9ROSI|nr:hypothetical protein K2173_007885 [Erythroxylum novogranatense]